MAAIFPAVYSASQRRAPTRIPSVHLAVQSSFPQIPFVAVTEAARGTHNPHATCLKLIESTSEIKPYAGLQYIKARSCRVNWREK